MSKEILPIGMLIEGPAFRDAIHIAIAPVTANEDLEPGQHVCLCDDSTHIVNGGLKNNIGIVDPYLRETVKKGQSFYLFLYPNTITSLRHSWTHPAFSFKGKGE